MLIFPKNFLEFMWDTIQKLGIINLSSCRIMSCVSMVLRDSEVAFLGEEEDAAFYQFLFYVLFIQGIV